MTQNTPLMNIVEGTKGSDRGLRDTRSVAHPKPPSVSPYHPCFRPRLSTLCPRHPVRRCVAE
jgi:hypothetical protein